jgi:ribonuclease HI
MCATCCASIFRRQNNVAEYEALVNGLRIAIELGVRRLDARGDSQLVIDRVMKNSHCRDQKMEAYCDEVGDLVLRLRQDARWRHQLTPPWEGPFIIAKILKPRTYKLANDQGEVYSNAWNIQQLRRFYP